MVALSFISIGLSATGPAYAAWGDDTISAMAGPWPITIKTCAHDAGAICSLTWRDKQFINDFDHGRQLQSASHFDGRGEAFNPTEAGGSYDGHNYDDQGRFRPRPSSSVLQGKWTKRNVLATQTRMAFWVPVNDVKLSNHILNKQVTIGALGLAHVIEYRTQFTIPANETHTAATFEAVTGYMPPEFSKFWTLDVKHGASQVRPLTDGPGEQNLPIIFSTPDGKWAMGIYSPDSPQATYPGAGYGRWKFRGVVKWNNVYRVNDPSNLSGAYHFRSYVIVGSLDNVIVSMRQLHDAVASSTSQNSGS
ncbi:MAG: hypothetical protein HY308_09020 [Gammaproteobacteria bacterium]|nr:hypothetical protein [Gammaproteobacteria bacterium]